MFSNVNEKHFIKYRCKFVETTLKTRLFIRVMLNNVIKFGIFYYKNLKQEIKIFVLIYLFNKIKFIYPVTLHSAVNNQIMMRICVSHVVGSRVPECLRRIVIFFQCMCVLYKNLKHRCVHKLTSHSLSAVYVLSEDFPKNIALIESICPVVQ